MIDPKGGPPRQEFLEATRVGLIARVAEERKLHEDFARFASQVLGGMMDAVAAALRFGLEVGLAEIPRIADATLFVTGAEMCWGHATPARSRSVGSQRSQVARLAYNPIEAIEVPAESSKSTTHAARVSWTPKLATDSRTRRINGSDLGPSV